MELLGLFSVIVLGVLLAMYREYKFKTKIAKLHKANAELKVLIRRFDKLQDNR